MESLGLRTRLEDLEWGSKMLVPLMLLIRYIAQIPVISYEINHSIVDIGLSQQGRSIKVERFGTGPESIVIMASIHGTEVGRDIVMQSVG